MFFLIENSGISEQFAVIFTHIESYHAAKLADKEDNNKLTLSTACSEGCHFESIAR